MSRNEISEKITDMILNGASKEEIKVMIEYSKEVIDAEKEVLV